MKNFKATIFLFCFSLCLFGFSGSKPVKPACFSCSENQAIGQAHAALASCIGGNQAGLNIIYSASPNNLEGGYTVTVIGGPRCHPGEACPFFAILIGTVVLDGNCNVVSVTCGFSN